MVCPTFALLMVTPLAALGSIDGQRRLGASTSRLSILPCLKGFGYEDPDLNHVNGGWVHSARTCQTTCRDVHRCHYFTWDENTRACMLQGPNSRLVKMPGATSGPKHSTRCSSNPTTTTGNMAASATTAPVQPAALPAVDVTTTRNALFPGLPGELLITTTTTSTTTGASGFMAILPWWGWMLIGLGVVILGVALLAGLCCGRSSSGKDKRRKGARNKVASQSGRQTLAKKERMDAMVEEMGSRHSEEYNAMEGVDIDMGSRSVPFQPLPSLPDPIPTVSAQIPTYSNVPQAGLLSSPQLPMAPAQRAMSTVPSPIPLLQAVMQPTSLIPTLGFASQGMQPMSLGSLRPSPTGFTPSGSYMPVPTAVQVPMNFARMPVTMY